MKKAFEQEISALKKISLIKNENIIALHEYFEDMNYCYMVMEYCNQKDLMNILLKQPKG